MRWSSPPLGVKLLAAFFAFGASMCLLTIVLLVFPATSLDWLWAANPAAHAAFSRMSSWAVLLMLLAGIACALAAAGLVHCAEWGRRLAITILCVNLIGDIANAAFRGDYRAVVGVPIGGLMIAYLLSRRVRNAFAQ